MLEVKDLKKKYKSKKGGETQALKGINLKLGDTGLVFILGKSGCGKSTFLNLLGGLDKFDSGEIIVNGRSSKDFSMSDFDSYRNTYLGFVFQEFNIIESFSIEKNIALALQLQHKKEDKTAIAEILKKVELENFGKRKPNELSGGQKQRVAIARALVKDPEIILADEPTGALDSATGKSILKTLKQLSKEKLVIIVSHDREFAEEYADRIVELLDGEIISDRSRVTNENGEETMAEIAQIDKNILRIPRGKALDTEAIEKLNAHLANSREDTFLLLASENQTAEVFPSQIADMRENGVKSSSGFESTNDEEIKSNKKAIKLIKSRLPLFDAIKIGASNFKAKKVRMIFTVLLSVVSLCFFGLADMFASYDKAETYTRAYIEGNASYMNVQKTYEENGFTSTVPFLKEDVDSLMQTLGNDAIKVYSNGAYANVQFAKSSNDIFFNPTSPDGFLEMKENSDIVAYGKFPTAHDEVMISDYTAKAYLDLGTMVNGYNGKQEMVFLSYDQILTQTLSVGENSYMSSQSDAKEYKIVGIYKTNYHFYQQMLDGKTKEDVYSDTEVQNLSTNLTEDANMFYNKMIVAEGFGESLKLSLENYNAGLAMEMGDADNYFSMYNKLSIAIDPTGTLARGEVKIPYEYYKYAKYGYEISKTKAQLDGDFASPQSYNSYIRAVEWNSASPIIFQKSYNVTGLVGEYYEDNIMWTSSASAVSDSTFEYQQNTLYMNEEDYWEVMDVVYNPSAIMINARMNGDELYSQITNLNNLGYSVSARSDWQLSLASSMMGILQKAFLTAAAVLALFVVLLMYNFISTSITNKQKEIGILRAIGARGTDIMNIFLFESLMLGAIILGISIPAVIFASNTLTGLLLQAMPITIVTFKIRQVFTMTAITLAIITIASFIPVLRISRKKPIDAILNK